MKITTFLYELKKLITQFETEYYMQPYWKGYHDTIFGSAHEANLKMGDYVVVDTSVYENGWRKPQNKEYPMGKIIDQSPDTEVGSPIWVQILDAYRMGGKDL